MSGLRPAQARGPFVGTNSGGTGPAGPPGPPGTPGASGSGTWVKTTVPYTAFAAASLQASFMFYSLLGTYDIQRTVIVPTTPFVGAGITAITASVGIAGDTQQLAPDFSLAAVASNTLQYSNIGIMYDIVAATGILVTAKSTGANLNALTAGSVDIYLFVTNLNNL